MGSEDQREYVKYYGIYEYDWYANFGTFSNHHYLLVKNYISEGCSTLDSSEASLTHEFLYPHHIKKIYWIEGVAEGEICLAASGCTSTVTSYRVSICKMNLDNTPTELATTGWITVNDTLAWDAGLSIGEEMVYHYRIDTLQQEQKLEVNDRIYLKIEVKCNSCTHLMHSNDSSWTDIWIDVPFRL